MKASKVETVEITLVMNKQEAEWLKDLVQDPLYRQQFPYSQQELMIHRTYRVNLYESLCKAIKGPGAEI